MTVEHLIPGALGGSLSCRFLCRACNSWLGRKVEAFARSDPSVLIAVHKLHGQIPEQLHRLVEHHPHIAIGEGPRTSGHLRDGVFHTKPDELDDGSLVLPIDEGRNAIAKMLKRSDYGPETIRRALETFDVMPENEKTTIVPGLEAVNWRVEKADLDLSESKLIDPLLPAKIAFEFLALCAGTAIYVDNWPLRQLREILKTATRWDDTILQVERLKAGDSTPFHGICNEEHSDCSQFQIRLFGSLAYRVRFPRLRLEGPRYAYTHTLNTGEEDWRIID